MNLLNRLPLVRRKSLINNPHFWILIVIALGTILLYCTIILLVSRPDWLREIEILEFQIGFHGILFFIPIIYTAIVFWWRGVLIMWLISVTIAVPLAFFYRPYPSSILVNVFYLCIPVLIVALIAVELNWREKEKKALVEREEIRQTYVAQIFRAQEDERKRIAQGLHDDTLHSLLVVAGQMQNMEDKKNSQTKKQLLETSGILRNDILLVADNLRRLTLDLRPVILDNVGFVPALIWLTERLNQEGKINTKLVVQGEERKIPHGTDVILFRIIQEALNNIRVHSEATEVVITLIFGTEFIKIMVRDNGKGFTLSRRIGTYALKGKLGLIGMRERMRSIKGTFHVRSKPGEGTLVSVEFKL